VELRARRCFGLTLPISPAALLGRPLRALNIDRARELIEGKRVLVTGAGGTIGSELARQVAGYAPARLMLFDSAEYNLYMIDQDIGENWPQLSRATMLGDVRDTARVAQIFEEERPEVVLHAAALKHVPLMETHPCEASTTNVGGTRVVAEAAYAADVDAFVLISTDKAVNPTNVMGATKRVAEFVVQSIAARRPRGRFSTVRFGNVLGSTGSVLPLFERQIARGGPVTVTHPDMERWFMTVEEAAGLVLQAAALPPPPAGLSAAVYVLDMGQPVRIEDLARQMISLKGLKLGTDITITHTGLRPGEKIREEIFYAAEDVFPSGADGILVARSPAPSPEALGPAVDALLSAASSRDRGRTLALLVALAPPPRA